MSRPVTTTARDPLLRQIFAEQDRLRISSARLSYMSGISVYKIRHYRHPNDHGKLVLLRDVRHLAEALDFNFPSKLLKNGDH